MGIGIWQYLWRTKGISEALVHKMLVTPSFHPTQRGNGPKTGS